MSAFGRAVAASTREASGVVLPSCVLSTVVTRHSIAGRDGVVCLEQGSADGCVSGTRITGLGGRTLIRVIRGDEGLFIICS